MSADEAKPMREARVRELAARAEKLAAAAAAKAQKQRERALERERQQVLDAAAQVCSLRLRRSMHSTCWVTQ